LTFGCPTRYLSPLNSQHIMQITPGHCVYIDLPIIELNSQNVSTGLQDYGYYITKQVQ